MSASPEMQNFHSALMGIVGVSAERNPRRRRKEVPVFASGRARRNMAVRIPYDGKELTFDTVAEAVAFLREMRGTGSGGAQQSAPQQTASTAMQRAASSFQPPSTQLTPKKEYRGKQVSPDDDRQPSLGQGKIIGFSVGGMKALCGPGSREPESFASALYRMGLTKGKASQVIQQLIDEDVVAYHKGQEQKYRTEAPHKQARAREILFEIGGISCAIKNPRFWSRAY